MPFLWLFSCWTKAFTTDKVAHGLYYLYGAAPFEQTASVQFIISETLLRQV